MLRNAHFIYIEVDQRSANIGRIYLNYDHHKDYAMGLHHHATTKTHQLGVHGVLDFDPLEAMLAIPDEGETPKAYCITIEHSARDLEVVDDRIVTCVDRLADHKPLTRFFGVLDLLLTTGQSSSEEQKQVREAFDWPLPSTWLP